MRQHKFMSLSQLPEMQQAMIDSSDSVCHGNPLPPMLVVLPRSAELEPVMDGLCAELEQAGMVDFTGTKRWLGIRIDHPEEQGFASFERMLAALRRCAGYRNCFGGVVHIDLTAWLTHTDDERMDALFAFIYDYSDRIFFIISVSVSEPGDADSLRKALRRWMYVSTADISPSQPCHFIGFVEDRLAASGKSLSHSGYEVITDTVEHLVRQEDFAGMREIDCLVSSIITSTLNTDELSAAHLADFSTDGSWLRLRSEASRTAIGFEGGNSND